MNGVNWLVTEGEKIVLPTDKTRKKYRLATCGPPIQTLFSGTMTEFHCWHTCNTVPCMYFLASIHVSTFCCMVHKQGTEHVNFVKRNICQTRQDFLKEHINALFVTRHKKVQNCKGITFHLRWQYTCMGNLSLYSYLQTYQDEKDLFLSTFKSAAFLAVEFHHQQFTILFR